ncbi:TIGR04053 family radical SAM/SPASM domain-containing protein [Haloferula rosea]|uniref:TIGR04053 family radical SAM/SPASM domain-containing protein n=1 Tax=Haloferula rosea TaxID=490093 RepID=A0A934VEA6_9BACT|nr:TIGR04053 family radical SAM/SPASM domain-containing protein [Haloferula rosea]MBK1825767.1 TIGR04053 family radical SAM/SPASM domain-containing protein [Haloferula rosea]
MVAPFQNSTADKDPFAARPFLVFWEITRACALACQHCRAEAQPRRDPRELNHDEAFKLVDQLAELAPPMLILTGGDPLMRKDVLEIGRRASDAGMRVGLSPSGTQRLVNYDFSSIHDAGIKRISLSLDGATAETHDRFRGVPHTFDRTIKAVHMAHDAGLSVQINTTLAASNLHEFHAFRDLMFELKPEMWSVFILVPTGRAGAADVPAADDLERIFAEMADLVGNAPFAIKTTEGHHFRRVLAQRGKGGNKGRQGMRSPLGIRDGRGVMFISHTGVVSPSGFLPFECGTVREHHPAWIYRNHPLFVSLRDSDALGGKCGRCEFRKICGGSRSRAYGMTGDAFAADPSCSYEPAMLNS